MSKEGELQPLKGGGTAPLVRGLGLFTSSGLCCGNRC